MVTAQLSGRPIPLPPMALRLMGDSDEAFVAAGVHQAGRLTQLGLGPEHRLLDVGCSVGRTAIGLLASTDFRGRYVGLDVMHKQVTWAAHNVSPTAPRFYFRHLDIRNDRYNPRGAFEPSEMKFPVADGRYHMACLFSVFTHFYRSDVEVYLRELRRVLRPGGLVLATWFLYDETNPGPAIESSLYPMAHRLDDVTIYNEASDPLRAIAFSQTFVQEQIREAGLEIVRIDLGTWAGGPGREVQDTVILRKPTAESKPPSRPVLARLRRRLFG